MPDFVQTVFDQFDLPKDRSPESFRYRVSFLWNTATVEKYFTDLPSERDKLVATAEASSYDVLVELGEQPLNPDYHGPACGCDKCLNRS